MSSTNTDYNSMKNQLNLNNANSILGSSNANSIAGISGDVLQQWAMLGANSKAYKALQQAEKTGSLRQNETYSELLSDKYFNDNYNPETKKYTATYSPTTAGVDEITQDEDDTYADALTDMRALALAAISTPDKMNQAHYSYFDKLRSSIAGSLVTSGSNTTKTEVESEAAQEATVTQTADFRLLEDAQRFTVAGNEGEVTYSFGVGTSLEDMVASINSDAKSTGITAALTETEDGKYEISFASAETGVDQFVRIDQHQGDLFAAAGSSTSAKGKDAVKGEAETVATGEDTRAAMAAGIAYGKLFDDTSFEIQGRTGTETFSFKKGATAEEVVSAINDAKDKTGVEAEVIYNDAGEAEGIGLVANKAGSGNYIQVKQTEGDLFTAAGKTTSVAGSSSSKSSSADDPAITSLSDLGRVTIDGQTYSFADLSGKASLASNPDAALAVLDQAIKDIYDGRAVLKGFDITADDSYISGVKANTAASSASNTAVHQDYGSSAVQNWIKPYVVDSDS